MFLAKEDFAANLRIDKTNKISTFSGPIYTRRRGPATFIGSPRAQVPTAFFKIVYFIDRNGKLQTRSFIMAQDKDAISDKNARTRNINLGAFEVPVSVIEEETGLVFNSTAAGTKESASQLLDCFPAGAHVSVDGRAVRLDELHVGDKVASGAAGKSSPIFMFSHAGREGLFEFVQLVTTMGALRASAGHLVHSGRGPLRARDVIVGDELPRIDGSYATVTAIKRVTDQGLFNPQTLDGNIVVDGFVVSTYTEAVPVKAAVPLLAPARALFVAAGIDASFGSLGVNGIVRGVCVAVLRALRMVSCGLSS